MKETDKKQILEHVKKAYDAFFSVNEMVVGVHDLTIENIKELPNYLRDIYDENRKIEGHLCGIERIFKKGDEK